MKYTTKCNIHCRKDSGGRPDVDKHINEMGAFFLMRIIWMKNASGLTDKSKDE